MADPGGMRREVLFQLSDVARALRTYVDQRAREHNMTRAQWAVLSRLERQEGMTQAELAETLEIQPISLLRLIERLCEQGQIERRRHPSDRRANVLYLTEKGRETLMLMNPIGREIAADAFADFREQDIGDLLERLLLVKRNIRQAARQQDGLAARGGRHAR